MKIYLVTREDIFAGMAAARRVRCYAKALMAKNIDLEVVLIKLPQNSIAEREGIYEGIHYRVCGRKISTNRRNLYRYYGYYESDKEMLSYLRKVLKPHDVIFEYGSTVIHTFLLINLAHQKGASYVRDLVEYPYGTKRDTFLSNLFRNILLKFQFPRYDGVIAISETLYELTKANASPACKVIKVPILVEYETFNLEDKSSSSEKKYIFHSGTLYEQKDGFVSMIKAFADANISPSWVFVSTGNKLNSPHAAEIDKIIEDKDLSGRVEFTGYLTNDELKEKLQSASLVIINKFENQQNKYCFSTKLAEYMAAGKAVILTDVGEAKYWLKDGKDSLIITPSHDALKEAIEKMTSDNSLRMRLGAEARETCKSSFDYTVWQDPLQNFFKEVSSHQ